MSSPKLAKLRATVRQAEGLVGGKGPVRSIEEIRAADLLQHKQARRQAAALYIPRPKNKSRRTRFEKNTRKWLRWYFNEIFTEPFCDHHEAMIDAIDRATTYGGDQAIAAPRGEAKTTIAECVTLAKVLAGVISFSVLFAATSYHAGNSLKSMKQYLVDSDRIAADYPEVWYPVAQADARPQLAHSMVAYGDDFPLTEIGFQWSGDEVTMPAVPGSRCAGSIIATRGLDSAVLGLKKGTRRPQLALIDDPDTEDTIRNPEQGQKLEDRIDRAIAGLAPRGKRMIRVMLTTTRNRTCVSFRYTDPTTKPSWGGKRFSFLKKKPDREDLWEEYESTRQAALREIDASGKQQDPFARRAHRFYLERREAMDAGGEAANPYPSSYDGRTLPDGSQLQVSAFQRFYDFVADNGLDSALSELQNDPPEESAPQESGISAYRIQTQVSGYPRRTIPQGCVRLTQGIDCKKVALHFVVRAWKEDGTGYNIDYGVEDVYGTVVGSDEGLDEALLRALRSRQDAIASNPYTFEDGRPAVVDQTLVDAGWRTETIYRFCREAGLGWRPMMGLGKSAGCVGHTFRAPVRPTTDRRIGHRWFLSRQPNGVWLVMDDTDHWKAWEHDHWMRDPEKAGALLNFGYPSDNPARLSADQKGHFSYAKHIVAEIEVEEPVKGVLKRYWKPKSDNNHYFDASRMATVAASMCGIPLTGAVARAAAGPKGPRKSMSELAAMAAGK